MNNLKKVGAAILIAIIATLVGGLLSLGCGYGFHTGAEIVYVHLAATVAAIIFLFLVGLVYMLWEYICK